MVLWVLLGFWLIVGGAAARVALSARSDRERAQHGFEVLKHVTRYGLGASAITAIITSLDKAGVGDALHNLINK
jgi:hypothetical protein